MAAPPIMQWLPMRVLPAMPAQPAIAVCAPIVHVVADLDLVVELHAVLDHRVVQRAAVDGGVGADLDVVADDHAADLRNLAPTRRSSCAKPKPSAPITAPEWMIARCADARTGDRPRRRAYRRLAVADRDRPRPTQQPGPIDDVARRASTPRRARRRHRCSPAGSTRRRARHGRLDARPVRAAVRRAGARRRARNRGTDRRRRCAAAAVSARGPRRPGSRAEARVAASCCGVY